MEHTSDMVKDGKLLHESSYPQRTGKFIELNLGNAKIDYFDAKNKVVHEIKRGRKLEQAHRWQVKYYLILLEDAGILGANALLEYPALRKTEPVKLEPGDRAYLLNVATEINIIYNKPDSPGKIAKKFCRSCSYYDFCWSE